VKSRNNLTCVTADSSVGIVTRVLAGQPGNRALILGKW